MRTITSEMNDAANHEYGYELVSKMEVYPTRVFMEALDDDNAVPGADPLGVFDDPLRQDIIYNATVGGLVTFYADGALKYAKQGNSTPVTTVKTSALKPGVFGDKIFVQEGANIKRYTIDWSLVAAGSTNPFSLEATLVMTEVPNAIHALSETECAVICADNGGFTIVYFNGTTEIISTSRFMFPKFVSWDDAADRDMESLAIFSGAALLNGVPFVYMSNASSGMVQGILYDPDTEVWSDIFTALPTDLQVSLCEFRIANCYERHGFVYMAGQFNRTDVYGTAKVYSLVLRSEDGRTFSIDQFTLVSDTGYRFLATIGSDNNLYIGNCNRVASRPVTWYFDGDDYTTSQMLELSEDVIGSISDTDTNHVSVALKAGAEQFVDSYVGEYALVKFFCGYKTVVGNQFVLYGTYIIEAKPKESYRNGSRQFNFQATNVSVYKLTGLSMPFYAEILGLSSIYDPMNKVTGKLYAAPNATRTETKFQIDFWQWKGYARAASSITAIDEPENSMNGMDVLELAGNHKSGLILKSTVAEILGLSANPKITGTSLSTRIYGWSKPSGPGLPNDKVNVVLVHCDEKGEDEQTVITTGSDTWKITYPYTSGSNEYVSKTITGLTVGRYIKYVGLVLEATSSTEAVPARIEFLDNVEVPVSLSTGDIPWTLGEDGIFRVPSAGQPFIMFGQRPYNVQNFLLTAKFTNSVAGNITGYPVGVGLVGLAEDASNCILARFDTTSNKAQLVKIRNGIETILEEATPGFTINDEQSMEFKHKDGKFEIYMFRDSNQQFELVLTYLWEAADGFMFTSRTATMKCGIYGLISAPICKILAFAKGSEDSTNADSLPIDPLADITDFPSSGKLRVGTNVYTYAGKIAHPTVVRGPYQLRTAGVYPAPYGNGHAGLEVRDFDWNGNNSVTTGKIIALDSGNCYLSIGDLWRIFISTGGVVEWLRNRARYYSADSDIAETSQFNNRVWIVGGFSGIGLFSGEPTRYSVGEHAILELSGEIQCHWFMGSGGESDTTVEDLVDRICKYSGAKATFSGDFLDDSLVVSAEVQIFQDDYAEGFDLSYETSEPLSHDLRTNVKIFPDNYEEKDDIELDTETHIVITYDGGGLYRMKLVSMPSETVMFQHSYQSGTERQKFRVLYYGSNVSFYQNERWVTTITLDKLIYTQASYIDIRAFNGGSIVFENVRVKDLGDWREAIYVDLETDGNSAIGGVIQERPVEIVSQPDGSLDFHYELNRDLVILTVPPLRHSYEEKDPPQAGSDGIIYGAGDVQTIQYSKFAKSKGLATKLIRVPNLDIGALEAGFRMMDRFYESRGHHELGIRPNLKIQPGDKLSFSYTLKGTGTVKSYTIIVETVELSIQMAKTKVTAMNITGRNVLP